MITFTGPGPMAPVTGPVTEPQTSQAVRFGNHHNEVPVIATRNGNAHDGSRVAKLLGYQRGFGALGGATAVAITKDNQQKLWDFVGNDADLKKTVDFDKHAVIVALAAESTGGSPVAKVMADCQ